MLDADFWRDRRVLVTGHTGFKGAWLTLWLDNMGARVSALALPAGDPASLYNLVHPDLQVERLADLREPGALAAFCAETEPEIVLHLAAQSLVRPSYAAPSETFDVNVMGTAHVLDAIRKTASVRAGVIVTTDKVYQNLERGHPFVEGDPLGGHDPYSASKACAELLTASYRSSFFSRPDDPRIATARAGNVIGGGDWSLDRIVPDLLRALDAGEPVRLRYPTAVRPWQHVLEPLAGYLMMAQALAMNPRLEIDTLNFAPDSGNVKTVAELVDAFSSSFDGRPGWVREPGVHLREAEFLTLSAAKAEAVLGWHPLLDFDATVDWTAAWYKAHRDGRDMRGVTLDQIASFVERSSPVAGTASTGAAERSLA